MASEIDLLDSNVSTQSSHKLNSVDVLPLMKRSRDFAFMSFCESDLSVNDFGNGKLEMCVDLNIESMATSWALCDPDYHENIISVSELLKYDVYDYIKLSRTGNTRLDNGNLVDIIGTIQVKIDVEGNDHDVEFFIVEQSEPDIILGQSFFESCQLLQEFEESVYGENGLEIQQTQHNESHDGSEVSNW